jgi:hypothetical protein
MPQSKKMKCLYALQLRDIHLVSIKEQWVKYSTVFKSTDSGARPVGSQLPFLAVWSWAGSLTFLYLGFLIKQASGTNCTKSIDCFENLKIVSSNSDYTSYILNEYNVVWWGQWWCVGSIKGKVVKKIEVGLLRGWTIRTACYSLLGIRALSAKPYDQSSFGQNNLAY